MRKSVFVPAGLALAAILVLGVLLSARGTSPPSLAPRASAPLPPAAPTAQLAREAAPAAGSGSSQPAAPPGAATRLAAATAPAAGDDLKTVVVTPHPVHVVPDREDTPTLPIVLKGRDGRDMTPRRAPQLAARPSPRRAHEAAPAQSRVVMIRGSARVDDAAALMVHGRVVHLFGVRPPPAGDRCAMGARAAPRACGEIARTALAERLKKDAAVSCRVPPGQRAAVPGAICLDSTGVDLGGFLVAEGFALADPAQSYDYVGAEGVARSFRRGLWRYR